jgi:hypothetical protein
MKRLTNFTLFKWSFMITLVRVACRPMKTLWWHKVEPLFTHIREISQRFYTPGSNVIIDEIILPFSGRFAHIFK